MALTDDEKKKLIEDALAMIEERGGVAALHEDLAEFRQLWIRMSQEHPRLLEKHPNKWVAMGKGGAMVIADSRDAALDAIEDKGIPREKAVVDFLDTDPPILIL